MMCSDFGALKINGGCIIQFSPSMKGTHFIRQFVVRLMRNKDNCSGFNRFLSDDTFTFAQTNFFAHTF